jgi:hypothetical protein
MEFKYLQANNDFVNCENTSYPRISKRDVLLGRGNCKHYGNAKRRQLVAVNLTTDHEYHRKKILLIRLYGK